MEYQPSQQTQSSPVSTDRPAPKIPDNKARVWKIIAIILGIVIVLFALLATYGFYLPKQVISDAFSQRTDRNQSEHEAIVTAIMKTTNDVMKSGDPQEVEVYMASVYGLTTVTDGRALEIAQEYTSSPQMAQELENRLRDAKAKYDFTVAGDKVDVITDMYGTGELKMAGMIISANEELFHVEKTGGQWIFITGL
jgi:hypothetical protein